MNRLDEPSSAIRTEKDLKVRTRLMAVRAVPEPGHSAENMAVPRDGGPAQVPDRLPAHERRRGDVAQIQAGHPGVRISRLAGG